MLYQDAAQELVSKIKAFGCSVEDLDTGKITSESVNFWANQTHVHNEDLLSDREEPAFSNAELFAIATLSTYIAKKLNA